MGKIRTGIQVPGAQHSAGFPKYPINTFPSFSRQLDIPCCPAKSQVLLSAGVEKLHMAPAGDKMEGRA